MRIFLLSIMFLITAINTPTSAQVQLTDTDYDAAVKMLRSSTNELIDRSTVRPRWTDNGSFWYKISDNGKDEFVHFNPRLKRKLLLLHRKKLLKIFQKS